MTQIDQLLRQGDRAVLQAAAVQHHGTARDTTGGRELVHQAAAHTHVLVFGTLRDARDLEWRERGPAGWGHRPGGCQLEGGRRRQTRALRQGAHEHAPEPGHRQVRTCHLPGGAREVVDPQAAGRTHLGHVHRIGRPGRVERHRCATITRGLQRDADLEVDGHRQHVAVVVVGVLADEVHAAGSAHDSHGGRVAGPVGERPQTRDHARSIDAIAAVYPHPGIVRAVQERIG